MTDKGKGKAHAHSSSGSSQVAEPEEHRYIGRAVLTFSFLGTKCYAATSYPHPIEEVQRKNENEYRDIVV